MLALDASRPSALAEAIFQLFQSIDEQAHASGARQPGGIFNLRVHSLGTIVPRARRTRKAPGYTEANWREPRRSMGTKSRHSSPV
jgi:hypothetical protein